MIQELFALPADAILDWAEENGHIHKLLEVAGLIRSRVKPDPDSIELAYSISRNEFDIDFSVLAGHVDNSLDGRKEMERVSAIMDALNRKVQA